MADCEFELLAIGAGPANLGLAVALEELAPDDLVGNSLIIERDESIAWQRGMLMPWAQSQVSFLKDLVSLRNPRSRFSFLNFLHSVGRLDHFVNLASFTPYRIEISEYLRWVADSLERVRIQYRKSCVAVDVARDRAGRPEGWCTRLADGSTIRSKILVFGVGREPNVPAPFTGLPTDRVVHSTQYVQRMAELHKKPPEERPQRVVVVGGAQSSAEMFSAIQRDLPECRPTLLMRSVGFTAYQTSRFTNELYFPSFVDEFYDALPSGRMQILREMHNTNYSGLSPSMIEELYREMYLQRLAGDPRMTIRRMVDVSTAYMRGDDVVLGLYDRCTGRTEELTCDLVLLGTGFAPQMPTLIRCLATELGVETVRVNRNYRLILDEPGPALCYLQGVNEVTHGIADSLLSVVAPRSAEIVMDILAHRDGAGPDVGTPTFASLDPPAPAVAGRTVHSGNS